MPGATEVTLDFRLIPGQSPADLIRRVDRLLALTLARYKKLSYELNVLEI